MAEGNELLGGEIKKGTILGRTNLIGFIGSAENKYYKENDVAIWDDMTKRVIYSRSFTSPVLSLLLFSDRFLFFSLLFFNNNNDNNNNNK